MAINGTRKDADVTVADEILRERFKEDNYLFLKGLLPREHALKAREAYFKYLSPAEVCQPETAPVDGIFDARNDLANFEGLSSRALDPENAPSTQAARFTDLTTRVHTEKWYTDDFCQHPNLVEFIERLTKWKEVRQFKRSLFRCNLPHSSPIGVHYDQIFLRKGDVSNITAWCAMGDIKINGGGLMYLEESAALGEEIEAEFSRSAKEAGLSEEEAQNAYNRNMTTVGGLSVKPAEYADQHQRRWLVSSYEAGDVVLHSPFTVHASTVNTDPENVIRLSTDLRFYDATRKYDERWLNYFYPGDNL